MGAEQLPDIERRALRVGVAVACGVLVVAAVAIAGTPPRGPRLVPTGAPTIAPWGRCYGVQGLQEGADPHIGRPPPLREAAEYGIIGQLNHDHGCDIPPRR